MTDTTKTKDELMQDIAETINQWPEDHLPELRAMINGFIAGVNSVVDKREAS